MSWLMFDAETMSVLKCGSVLTSIDLDSSPPGYVFYIVAAVLLHVYKMLIKNENMANNA